MYTCGISNPFGLLSPTLGQVAHVLRDRSPLGIATPFDLHFLGTSQAFVLSQDQTLHEWFATSSKHACLKKGKGHTVSFGNLVEV